MPIDTPESPRSTRASVLRVMKARSAMIAIVIRRRRRAAPMSSPSLLSARWTGPGSASSAIARFIWVINYPKSTMMGMLRHIMMPRRAADAGLQQGADQDRAVDPEQHGD